MKSLLIPLVDVRVTVYRGEAEWPRFVSVAKEHGAIIDDEPPEGDTGRSLEGWVWISDTAGRGTLIHELSHLIDNLMNLLVSQDTEFRAYLTEWTFERFLTWFEEIH